MKHCLPKFRNATHARRLVGVLAAATLACGCSDETTSVAGSWAPLAAGTQEATWWIPLREEDTGTSIWLEPLDLTTDLEPDRLRLRIGLLNPDRVLEPTEIQKAADTVQLLRWPEGSVVPSKAEIERTELGANLSDARRTNRTSIDVVPTENLEPGWYALRAGTDRLVSRFHVGSCPIVVGLSSCEGMDGLAVVFSEPVGKDADVQVISVDDAKRCSHDAERFENRNQSKSMRRYVSCNLDATKDAVRVRVGDVTVRQEKKLALPAGVKEDGVSSLDIVPQNYTKVGKCSHARVPLSAALPRCL